MLSETGAIKTKLFCYYTYNFNFLMMISTISDIDLVANILATRGVSSSSSIVKPIKSHTNKVTCAAHIYAKGRVQNGLKLI